MSRPTQGRAIVDAGLKALAFDSAPPLVCDEPTATYERASDEHGRLAVSAATNRLALGDKIRPDPRPLRPDRQPLRLVCLHPQQPRRAALADHRPRRGLLRGPVTTLKADPMSSERGHNPTAKGWQDNSPSFRPNFDHFLTEPSEKTRYSLSRRSCNLSISVDRRVVL